MRKSNVKGIERIVKLTISIILVAAFTVLMALLGFHLASRYKSTITGLFDSVTEKISGIENDIKEETENVISVPEK